MVYGPYVFAGNPLDRGDRERRDEEWLAARAVDPTSRFLVMPDLDVPTTGEGGGALRWLTQEDALRIGIDASETVFLGKQDGIAHFAVHVPAESRAAASLRGEDSAGLVDARSAAGFLSGPETGIMAQARALLDWHNRHGFCSVCGHRTAKGRGGHVRKCTECGAEHFPRTDPVAIMLVHDGDRCLLGQSRGRLSRMRMYSALAGFIDQGESIEEAVAREVRGGGGHRRQEHHVPLVAAVAVPVLADDRVPCRSRDDGHPHRRRGDDRRALVRPPGGDRRAGRAELDADCASADCDRAPPDQDVGAGEGLAVGAAVFAVAAPLLSSGTLLSNTNSL